MKRISEHPGLRECHIIKCPQQYSKIVEKEECGFFDYGTARMITYPQCNGRTIRLLTLVQISIVLNPRKW